MPLFLVHRPDELVYQKEHMSNHMRSALSEKPKHVRVPHVESVVRKPLPGDAKGRPLRIGDRVSSTDGFDDKRSWTGKIVGYVRAGFIEVDAEGQVFKSRASLWRYVGQ